MAVYTPLTRAQVAAFLAAYDLGALERHEGIAQGVSNTNYHVFTSRGRYILTLFEPRRMKAAEAPFFLDFMAHVGARGIPCPQPITARDGAALRTLADKPAVLLPFLPGREILDADLTPDHCAQMGALTARLHLAAADFPQRRVNPMGASCLAGMAHALQPHMGLHSRGLRALVDEELVHIAQHWPRNLPAGVVHADLFPDNVFFEDEGLAAVIDFYMSCTDFYAYDLSVTLNAWCFGPGPAQAAFLESYEAVRPLSEAERAALPVLRRAAALRFVLTRLEELTQHDPATMMTPKDPGEYIDKLLCLRGEA
ncbi:MAG TPA: homoserine kinase [Rhodospirillaceae bacterium]|jgi:homoserine kinase type II|nr:homoserine kinase [Alphaproteobacteria bacterium]HBH26251.1 homoserine kinase [Rhodospirillaceae bacterium]